MFNANSLSQASILFRIREYLKSLGRGRYFTKQFEEGYCAGISSLWLYSRWLQTQSNPEDVPRDDYDWFQSVLNSLLVFSEKERRRKEEGRELTKEELAIRKDIERFISHIQFFQRIDCYLHIAQGALEKSLEDTVMGRAIDKKSMEEAREDFETRLNELEKNKGVNKTEIEKVNKRIKKLKENMQKAKDIKTRRLTKEYSIASLFAYNQLEDLLQEEDFIQDKRLIFIGSHNHATALFKDGNKYYYFNPNNPRGQTECKSLKEVAYLIFEANGWVDRTKKNKPPLKGSFPLGFNIFSFEKKHKKYPLRDKILVKTNPKALEGDLTDRYTGLMIAAKTGCLKSVEYFLGEKFNSMFKNEKDKYGKNALIIATQSGYLDIINKLLDANLDINAQDNKKRTAIMVAVRSGYADIVDKFLAFNADVNIRDRNNWTALIIAAQLGYAKIVKSLLDGGADLNIVDARGATALMLAACNGYLDIVKFILEKRKALGSSSKYDNEALIVAAQNGHFDIVKVLLAADVDLYYQDKYGWTPLMYAAENGHFTVVEVLLENASKDDVNLQNISGGEVSGIEEGTALMIAIEKKRFKIVRLLLDAGADLHIKDKNGKTALAMLQEVVVPKNSSLTRVVKPFSQKDIEKELEAVKVARYEEVEIKDPKEPESSGLVI